jgi:hypothetical protein
MRKDGTSTSLVGHQVNLAGRPASHSDEGTMGRPTLLISHTVVGRPMVFSSESVWDVPFDSG